MGEKNTKRIVLIRSNPVRPYPRLEKMANCLVKNGYEVTVLAWDRDENYAPKEEILELKAAEVKIVRFGAKGQFSGGFKKNLKSLIRFQLFIRKWLYRHKNEYDVIHAYDFDTGYMASKCAKALEKKLVYDIPDYYVESHGLEKSKLGKIIKRMEDAVISKADATIICTEERRNQIKDAKPKKLYVVHNTPDTGVGPEPLKIPGEKLKFVYVGILGKTRFIDEIAQCISKRSDCEFHIGGFGANMEEYFEKLSKDFDNIFYYGRIPYNETLRLEGECDVMCALYDPKVPNHFYAAPNKFYEALMLGKPLIMAKNTGMASVVEENDLGEVIDYNEHALNVAIDRLVQRKNEWIEIGERARKLYVEKYSFGEMEKRIIELYSNL